MQIEIANISDIEALAQVEIESKMKSIPEIVEQFEIDYPSRIYRWQTYFKGESPKSSLPQRITFKAVSNNKIIGYLAGHFTNRYELDAEIQSFYVLKEFQRKGIGKLLLKVFVEWLINNNRNSLCVGFNQTNKYKAFYLKYGASYLNEHWAYWENLKYLHQKLKEE